MNAEEWFPSYDSLKASKVEDLKFIFSQGKDRLKELSDEGDRLYSKSLTFISISITFIIASGGYLFSLKSLNPLLFSALSVLILFWVIVSTLKDNIFPTEYLVPGTDPKELLIDPFFKPLKDYEDKSAEWYLIYNEIINYQLRIDFNKKANDERKGRLLYSYKLVYWAPIIFVLTYIISSLAFIAFYVNQP